MSAPSRTCALRLGVLAAGLALLAGTVFVVSRYHRYLEHRQQREEGLRLAEQGQFADAEPLLGSVLERDSSDIEVIKALALGYVAASKDADAEAYLTRWCILRPDQAEPHWRRMGVLQGMGKLEEALADGNRVLELEPTNGEAQKQVARILIEEGRFADLEHTCRQCLQKQPNHAGLLYSLAVSCYRQGKNDAARSILDRLIAEQPGYCEPLLLNAILHYEADEGAQAIPLLRQVLATYPSRNEARYYLSRALECTGQTAEAEREMAQFLRQSVLERMLYDIDLQPDNLELRIRAAEALLSSGRSEEAMRLLRRILARDPKHRVARGLLESHLGAKETVPQPE